MSDVPPVKENEYHLGSDGDKVYIHSVVIDKKTDTEMCDIYISDQINLNTIEGIKATNPVIIRIPQAALVGTLQSFSGSPSMSITYKDKVYNKANADNNELNGGNATVTLEDNEATIEFTLFQIKEYNSVSLVGYYNGEVTVIE